MAEREIINAEIGNRLHNARSTAGLTLEEAGKKVGLSGSVIRRYEIGTIKSVGIDIIKKFALAYGTTAQDLMGWEEPQQQGYYNDPETAALAEKLRTNPNMKLLFSAAKDLSSEEMQQAADYMNYLKTKEHNK